MCVNIKTVIFWDMTMCGIWGFHSGGYEEYHVATQRTTRRHIITDLLTYTSLKDRPTLGAKMKL
jgi:hypothetical protein